MHNLKRLSGRFFCHSFLGRQLRTNYVAIDAVLLRTIAPVFGVRDLKGALHLVAWRREIYQIVPNLTKISFRHYFATPDGVEIESSFNALWAPHTTLRVTYALKSPRAKGLSFAKIIIALWGAIILVRSTTIILEP